MKKTNFKKSIILFFTILSSFCYSTIFAQTNACSYNANPFKFSVTNQVSNGTGCTYTLDIEVDFTKITGGSKSVYIHFWPQSELAVGGSNANDPFGGSSNTIPVSSSSGKLSTSVGTIGINSFNSPRVLYSTYSFDNTVSMLSGTVTTISTNVINITGVVINSTDCSGLVMASWATNNNNNLQCKSTLGASTPLRVNFNHIQAQLKNNQLQVNWQSLNESDCKEFLIEASKDGVNWTNIGKVDSKAVNGVSFNALNYEFTTNLSDFNLAAISILFTVLLMPFVRNKLFKGLLILGLIVFSVSCYKSTGDVKKTDKTDLLVRVVQVDMNGTKFISKIQKVVEY